MGVNVLVSALLLLLLLLQHLHQHYLVYQNLLFSVLLALLGGLLLTCMRGKIKIKANK